jgi:hypothetical protein
MGKKHSVKVWPSYFEAMLRGDKTFEWQLNDRDYAVGDVLILREWDPHGLCGYGSFTRREAIAQITYKAEGVFGMPQGYCILGFREAKLVENGS